MNDAYALVTLWELDSLRLGRGLEGAGGPGAGSDRRAPSRAAAASRADPGGARRAILNESLIPKQRPPVGGLFDQITMQKTVRGL